MYLLYLDQAGNAGHAGERHFVLAGAAVFERATFHMTRALDALQRRYLPEHPDTRIHAGDIRSGKGVWRRVPRLSRNAMLTDLGKVILDAYAPSVVLFGAVVDRAYGRGAPVVHAALEQCCRRFDLHLSRKVSDGHDQRGAVVLGGGTRAALVGTQEGAVGGPRLLGTSWGALKFVSDVALEAPAAATRPLQLAGYVAHALYAAYERRDARLLEPLYPRFDAKGGIMHGLVHMTARWRTCRCEPCSSRRVASADGAEEPAWSAEMERAAPLAAH